MESLIESIKRHEGCRLFPYIDTQDNVTIGWGRCLDKTGISQQEADSMLTNDLTRCEQDYYRLPETVRKNCSKQRKDILCEMIFQLGYMGVLKFKRMLGAIAANDFERASNEMLNSLWARQTPNRVAEMSEWMRAG